MRYIFEDPGAHGILEETASNTGNAWHGDVVPGDSAIVRAQEIAIAERPAIERVEHSQTADHRRRLDGPRHDYRCVGGCYGWWNLSRCIEPHNRWSHPGGFVIGGRTCGKDR